MILNKDIADTTAKMLLQIKAIQLELKNPFVWASGWKSPLYCDNRVVLSHPSIRNFLKESMAKIIFEKYGKPDVIAGVATGAIAIGVLIAQELDVPFVYVRSDAKKYGHQNQIEGVLETGSNVVVVEDLISTGKSSLNAVEVLNKANVNVMGMIAIFTYGFDIATENFKKANIDLITLSDYNHLLKEVCKDNYISKEELKILSDWRSSPSTWGNKN